MVKTKIIETTEKYDDKGNLIEKITREEESEDDEIRFSTPVLPNYFGEPMCVNLNNVKEK